MFGDDDEFDPSLDEPGVPGTVDDEPLTFGVEVPPAADLHVVDEGPTKVGDSCPEPGLPRDETELWNEQTALVEEDEDEGLKLAGFKDEEIPEILDAMGDDAADAVQDFPNGNSATGDWNTPEHGGFPEREE
jgi:hypothetical protein